MGTGGSASWEAALKLAKDRAELAEKRANMSAERAGELERTLRDSVRHVEYLEAELGNNNGKRSGGGGQGLTLVHFSAQLERFVWDRGCAQGL